MTDLYYRVTDIFFNYDWSHFLFRAKIISGALSFVFATAIVVISTKLMAYNFPKRAIAQKGAESEKAPLFMPIKTPWQEIMKKMESENPSDWSLAVIRADAIVDKILKGMRLPGETMGDRLKTLDKSRLASLDELWEAHLIRNEIAHSPEKTPTKHRAAQALGLFEKALRELGYIEP